MRYIKLINDELKMKILNFLYEDELFNVYLINVIEKQIDNIGEIYIEESYGDIGSILHIKFDGNSYFTSFFTKNEAGYKEIAKQLEIFKYKRILLAGKRKEVSKILSYLSKDVISSSDIYYKFNASKYLKQTSIPEIKFRQATYEQEDISKISEFMIDFFGATNEEEVADIANRRKLFEDIRLGVYFIEYNGQPIGMARYSGESKNFIDITTVYIQPNYRGRGFGKKLMLYIIDNIITSNKIPVTQTSSINIVARNTYESLGFIKEDDYLFEFIS